MRHICNQEINNFLVLLLNIILFELWLVFHNLFVIYTVVTVA